MKRLYRQGVIVSLVLLPVLVLAGSSGTGNHDTADSPLSPPDGFTRSQAMAFGEQIYRQGVLADGRTMKAFLQDDIAVDSRLFSCESCHRRSGLGSNEGYVVTLPINGRNLFRSRVLWDTRRRHSRVSSASSDARPIPDYMLADALRPAYTSTSLATAITTGVDSGGRKLSQVMPRYELDDISMALLVFYLRNLTNDYSPGVDKDSLEFATIVTEGVKASDREAMLSILRAHVTDHNAQMRNQQKRALVGAFNRREGDRAYRKINLSVWELKGHSDTWYEQLQTYYQRRPVFAILGGIAAGDWEPVHRFSESIGLPVVFPVTDQPVVPADDGYTVYFSKGLYQEGETAARFLRRHIPSRDRQHIVQIFNRASDGEILAAAFEATWNTLDSDRPLKQITTIDSLQDGLEYLVREPLENSVVLLWGDLDSSQFISLSKLLRNNENGRILMSSSLLNNRFDDIPDSLRDNLYLTYPYSLPGEKIRQKASLETWLKIKGIAADNLNIQSKIYFLGWILSDALVHMKSEFYRDYFLETLEMMKDQTHSIAVFPRLSLGPGQRYASKGCYVVQLSKGHEPELMAKSEWVIH